MKKEELELLRASIVKGDVETVRNLLDTIELFKGECKINDVEIRTRNYSDGTTRKYVYSLLHLIMVPEVPKKAELVAALLEKGADPNINDGYMISSAVQYPEVFELLRNASGKLNLNDIYAYIFYGEDPGTTARIIDASIDPNLTFSEFSEPYGDKSGELSVIKMLGHCLELEYRLRAIRTNRYPGSYHIKI